MSQYVIKPRDSWTTRSNDDLPAFDRSWIPDKARVQSNGFYDYRCTDPSPDGLDSAFRFPMSIQYAAPIGRYYVISTDLLPENNLQWSYFDYQDLPSRQDSTNYPG